MLFYLAAFCNYFTLMFSFLFIFRMYALYAFIGLYFGHRTEHIEQKHRTESYHGIFANDKSKYFSMEYVKGT